MNLRLSRYEQGTRCLTHAETICFQEHSPHGSGLADLSNRGWEYTSSVLQSRFRSTIIEQLSVRCCIFTPSTDTSNFACFGMYHFLFRGVTIQSQRRQKSCLVLYCWLTVSGLDTQTMRHDWPSGFDKLKHALTRSFWVMGG